MNLHDKIVIVSAASTGIGRAVAVEFAKEGAHLLLVARTKDRLLETKRLVEEVGASADIFLVDLSDISSINQFISSVKSEYKSIYALCNVAGIWHGENEVYAGKDYDSFTQEVIVDTFMVGTIAPALLAHAFIPLMSNTSSIINLSGTFESGAKGWLPYFVSKRAIEDLTVGLAEELKDRGIRVNGISPSDTATDAYQKYFPEYIPDAIEPEKIAEYAVLLCSEKAKEITGKVFVLKKGKEPFESFHF
ncbi:MAG TPA: SDR family oxidoreductase [Patescibacteria group bacterium]|nr:SDR family oxidoreductase [Patescibacteria group bacterium]